MTRRRPGEGTLLRYPTAKYAPGRGLAFYSLHGELRPQCNTDRRVIDIAVKGWTDGAAEVVYMDAVYMSNCA